MRALTELFLVAGASAGLLVPTILKGQNAAAKPPQRVVVAYYVASSQDRASVQSSPMLLDLSRYLTRRTARYFMPGYTVGLLLYSIDLAGDANRGAPRKNPGLWRLDLRLPGEYRFYYTITDPTGRVVESGKEDVVRWNDRTLYQTNATTNYQPSYFDERILDTWLSDHLSKPASGS